MKPQEYDAPCDKCGTNVIKFGIPNLSNDPQDEREEDKTQCEDCKWIEDFDPKKLDNITIDGVDTGDFPDFCDTYIVSADYDGVECTDIQLEALADLVPEKINEMAHEHYI